MLRRRDLRGVQIDSSLVLPRAELDLDDATDVVRPVVEDVRLRGEVAALDYSERFDGVRPANLRVTAEQIAAAVAALTPEIRAALEEAIRRVRIVHSAQQRVDVTTEVVPGGTVMERWIPVSRVGLYVPGGRAVYPSSVIMNVVVLVPSQSSPRRRRTTTVCRTPRSLPRAAFWASTRSMPWVAHRPSRCSPTAQISLTADVVCRWRW
jgi:hypothetical protein